MSSQLIASAKKDQGEFTTARFTPATTKKVKELADTLYMRPSHLIAIMVNEYMAMMTNPHYISSFLKHYHEYLKNLQTTGLIPPTPVVPAPKRKRMKAE